MGAILIHREAHRLEVEQKSAPKRVDSQQPSQYRLSLSRTGAKFAFPIVSRWPKTSTHKSGSCSSLHLTILPTPASFCRTRFILATSPGFICQRVLPFVPAAGALHGKPPPGSGGRKTGLALLWRQLPRILAVGSEACHRARSRPAEACEAPAVRGNRASAAALARYASPCRRIPERRRCRCAHCPARCRRTPRGADVFSGQAGDGRVRIAQRKSYAPGLRFADPGKVGAGVEDQLSVHTVHLKRYIPRVQRTACRLDSRSLDNLNTRRR